MRRLSSELGLPGVLGLLGGLAVAGVAGCHRGTDPGRTLRMEAAPPGRGVPAAESAWLLIGGGPVPEQSQLSIEADVGLAQSVLEASGQRGRLLFGAGPAGSPVSILVAASEPTLRDRLGAFFQPRGGRDGRYQPSRLPIDGPATRSEVELTLRAAFAASSRTPLFVGLFGHGDIGDNAKKNVMSLWGDSTLSVEELGGLLAETHPTRRIRFVVTTCYSGGFADLVFEQGAHDRGAGRADACGFFAAPWDLQASGCDPSPERRQHEGYAVFFFNALRGQDREGNPSTAFDLDKDGRVSLLEAHTAARLASPAIDVPTSTSERWLREVAPSEGAADAVDLVEEDVVVDTLSRRLGLVGQEETARARLEQLEDDADRLRTRMDDQSAAEDERFREASASLLARWPVLDDPWHPDFPATLEAEGPAIAEALEHDPAVLAYEAAKNDTDDLDDELWDVRLQAAPVERLVRALDNRLLAGRLKKKGGADWDTYARILACERSAP